MSYHTLSVIIATENETERGFLKTALVKEFPNAKTRKINTPFKGYIAQFNLKKQDEFELENPLTDYILKESPQFPDLKFAIIDVDCFGGKCASFGQLIQNGKVIQNEDYNHKGHFNLLKNLSEDYKSWHFEPFTRDYFVKKGSIWGEVKNFSFVAFSIALFSSYRENPDFRCDATHNELVLEKKEKYLLYFMQPSEDCFKILGSITDDSDETVQEVKQFIEEELSYLESYVFIDLIDKEQFFKFDHTGETGMSETQYRFQAFNERPLITEKDVIKPKSTSTTIKKQVGWLKSLFKKK